MRTFILKSPKDHELLRDKQSPQAQPSKQLNKPGQKKQSDIRRLVELAAFSENHQGSHTYSDPPDMFLTADPRGTGTETQRAWKTHENKQICYENKRIATCMVFVFRPSHSLFIFPPQDQLSALKTQLASAHLQASHTLPAHHVRPARGLEMS